MPDEDTRKNCDSTSNTRCSESGTKDIKCHVVPKWHKLGQRLVLCDSEVKLLMHNSQNDVHLLVQVSYVPVWHHLVIDVVK